MAEFRFCHGKVRVWVQMLSLVVLLHKIGAAEFQVGGSKGWSVSSDSKALDHWAEAHRFQIGDSLVFNYPAGQDSVLQVQQRDYENCNTDSPIKNFTGGRTVVKFEKSGAHYFISGNRDHCLKNEKLVVIVLADRSKQPSPPAPNATEIAPSPPPEASVQMNPTPSPIADEPPANAAAASVVGLLGVAGAFAASALVL